MISKLYILNNTNIICDTEMNQDTQMTQMLAKFENEYPWGYMEKFPEYCVNKINNIGVGNHKFDNIPEDALENLLEVGLRTRAHIIEWMTKYLTYESLMYIGW
tara:strand:- start:76 stop:384 length:309 start_codon:yes stop_codon:yes gene_type:complete